MALDKLPFHRQDFQETGFNINSGPLAKSELTEPNFYHYAIM